MQKHLENLKCDIDEKQTLKLRSRKPGKYEKQGQEVNRLIKIIHIKLMDQVRQLYFQSRDKVGIRKEESEIRHKIEDTEDSERN